MKSILLISTFWLFLFSASFMNGISSLENIQKSTDTLTFDNCNDFHDYQQEQLDYNMIDNLIFVEDEFGGDQEIIDFLWDSYEDASKEIEASRKRLCSKS